MKRKKLFKRLTVIIIVALCLLDGLCAAQVNDRVKFSISDSAVAVITPGLVFELADEQAGLGLLSVKHTGRDTEFMRHPNEPDQAKLWNLVLTKDRTKKDEFITITNTDNALERTARLEDGKVILTWKGLDVGEEKDVIDVIVYVTTWKDTDFSDWRIEVKNRSSIYGIWRIDFPVIELGQIGRTGADDYLIVPCAEGRSIRDPLNWSRNLKVDRITFDVTTDGEKYKVNVRKKASGFGHGGCKPWGFSYPSGHSQLQLYAYYEKKGNFYYPSQEKGPGLYLATLDSLAYPKSFFATEYPARGVLEFVVGNYTDDQGRPGLDYKMAYPMVIGAFEGDWFDACRIYRKWALKQRWTMSGTLAQRKDIPDWLKKITAWVRLDTYKYGEEGLIKALEQYRRELDGVLGVMWYRWDRHFLDKSRKGPVPYFPSMPIATKGFGSIVERFQKEDCVFFPIINMRLWCHNSPYIDFEQARPYRRLKADGEPMIWKTRKKGIMPATHICTQTKFWHEYLIDVCKQIVSNYGVKGFYVDQGGELNFTGHYDKQGCQDATHGHPLGMTRDLFESEYGFQRKLRQRVRQIDPEIVLMGESSAEAFIDIVNNKVIHYEIWPGYVPLFNAVYHDYMTSFGRSVRLSSQYLKNPEDPKPVMQIGFQLVLDNQIARLLPIDFNDPVSKKNMPYLKKACSLRSKWHKYLTLGQMMRPPYMSDVPEITTAEFSKLNKLCTLPAILGSVWKAPDGNIAVVLTNISQKPIEFEFGLDLKNYGLQGKKCALMQKFPEKKGVTC